MHLYLHLKCKILCVAFIDTVCDFILQIQDKTGCKQDIVVPRYDQVPVLTYLVPLGVTEPQTQ